MNKFAFIIHPTIIQDFYNQFPILEKTPDFMVRSIGKLLFPFKVSEIKGISNSAGELQGFLIALPLTLKQMLKLSEDQIAKRIIKAGHLAQKLGADIIGMDPYTSIIGKKSVFISQNLSIPITSGRIYTIVSAIEGIKKAAEWMGKDFRECDVTILGINENIGSVIARYFTKQAKYISLVSKNKELLENLSQKILTETGTAIHTSDHIQSTIKRADIIVIASNTEDINIKMETFKKGSIICDLSRPRIITKELEKERSDVLFMDGGIITLPYSVDFGFEFGLPKNTCSAALAETILLSLEKKFECFSLGDEIEIKKMDQVNKMAQDYHFNIAGVSSFYKEVPISNLKI